MSVHQVLVRNFIGGAEEEPFFASIAIDAGSGEIRGLCDDPTSGFTQQSWDEEMKIRMGWALGPAGAGSDVDAIFGVIRYNTFWGFSKVEEFPSFDEALAAAREAFNTPVVKQAKPFPPPPSPSNPPAPYAYHNDWNRIEQLQRVARANSKVAGLPVSEAMGYIMNSVEPSGGGELSPWAQGLFDALKGALRAGGADGGQVEGGPDVGAGQVGAFSTATADQVADQPAAEPPPQAEPERALSAVEVEKAPPANPEPDGDDEVDAVPEVEPEGEPEGSVTASAGAKARHSVSIKIPNGTISYQFEEDPVE